MLRYAVEVPALPAAYVPPVALAELKRQVLAAAAPREEKGGVCKASPPVLTAHGMGGVGKTTTAAAMVRDDEVRAAFERLCCAPPATRTRALRCFARALPPDWRAHARRASQG